MNKVTRLKYYIESLCIYDFEDDDVFSALYDLLCDDEEDTVALQSYFFKELAKSESLKRPPWAGRRGCSASARTQRR